MTFMNRKRVAFLAFLMTFTATQLKAATAVSWPPIGGSAYSVPAAGESGWASLSNYLIALQNAQGTTSQKTAIRVATTTPITVVSASDAVVVSNMGVASAVTVNLPAGVTGQYFAIVDGKGDAATNNITIDGNAAETVNGAATYVINKNRAGVILSWSGSGWIIIGEYANVASTGATPNATANTIASRNSLAQSFFDGVGHTGLLSAPTYVEGLMWYDDVDQTMRYYNDSSNDSVNIGQEINVKVRNNSGSTMNPGQVVRITGAIGGVPTVSLAQANAFATSRVFAVITETLTNNTNGYATISGLIKNLNLSAFNDGDLLYLSTSVAGGLQNTRPTSPNYVMPVGSVSSNNSSTGRLIVQMGLLRSVVFGSANQDRAMNTGVTEEEYKTDTGVANEIDVTLGSNSIQIGLNSAQEFPTQSGNSGKFLTTNGSAVSWSAVAGSDSQGVNYIVNGNFENSTNGVLPTGWLGFTDAAATTPADGTGGTSPPTGVTFLASTTSPLRGVLSAVLTKDANNRQGAGYSYDFTISSVDVSKKFQASLDMSVNSGTYVAGDVRVYLYDVTNSTLLTPQTVALPNATTSFVTTVDTTTSTSYRWIVYVSSTSASAYSLKFDSVYVGPSTVLNGAAISDWQDYTPSNTQGFGTISSNALQFRRLGSAIQVRGRFAAGTVTGSTAQLATPTGTTVSNAGGDICGEWVQANGSATTRKGGKIYCVSGLAYVQFTSDDYTTASSPFTPLAGSTMTSNSVTIAVEFNAPIAEWAGNGTLATGAGAQQEFASNSENLTTAGGTASASNTVAGSAGTPILAINSATTTGNSSTNFPVNFQYPLQADERPIVEISQGISNVWLPWEAVLPYVDVGTARYGIRLETVSASQVRVSFGNAGSINTGATYGAAGGAWSVLNGAGWRWRVSKAKASSPVGFGLASASDSGLISTTTQTFAGAKTFNDAMTIGASGISVQHQVNGEFTRRGTSGTATRLVGGAADTTENYFYLSSAGAKFRLQDNSANVGEVSTSGQWVLSGALRVGPSGPKSGFWTTNPTAGTSCATDCAATEVTNGFDGDSGQCSFAWVGATGVVTTCADTAASRICQCVGTSL